MKDSSSINEGLLSVYWFTATDEVLAKGTLRLSSRVNARQNKMPLLHDALMGILTPLADAASAIFEVDGGGSDVWKCFPIVVPY